MNYRSIEDLNESVKNWATKLPRDLDLIVAIPRSGLLVANILALHLNLPLTDVEHFLRGEVLASGRRPDFDDFELSGNKKVLVVDDSVNTGKQMNQIKSKMKQADLSHEILYGAVYLSSFAHSHVDYWEEVVSTPRVFEWNVLHHPVLNNSCVDIDGILCRDPTPEENDDGENYRDFVLNVEPKIIPSEKIGWLVTSRLEKYRDLTERWLDKHNVNYENLVMMDLPDKATRVARGNHASFKAEVFQSTDSVLFVESNLSQAREIVEITGESVFCVENWEMIDSENLAYYQRSRNLFQKFWDSFLDNPLGAFWETAIFIYIRVSKKVGKFIGKIKNIF